MPFARAFFILPFALCSPFPYPLALVLALLQKKARYAFAVNFFLSGSFKSYKKLRLLLYLSKYYSAITIHKPILIPLLPLLLHLRLIRVAVFSSIAALQVYAPWGITSIVCTELVVEPISWLVMVVVVVVAALLVVAA